MSDSFKIIINNNFFYDLIYEKDKNQSMCHDGYVVVYSSCGIDLMWAVRHVSGIYIPKVRIRRIRSFRTPRFRHFGTGKKKGARWLREIA